MLRKRPGFIFLMFLFCQSLFSQQKYWVEFRDKDSVSFNPFQYFDARTIARREKQGIPLVMETDLPVNEAYCSAVNDISPVLTSSRWLNAVVVSLKAKQEKEVKKLPFVAEVRRVESLYIAASSRAKSAFPDSGALALIRSQTGSLGGDLFKAAGIDGHGVRIAVFDAGFIGVDTFPEFRRLRQEGRIIDTWDFVRRRKNVYDFDSHGTGVLGCITGEYDSLPTGLGTGAEFLLARTEVRTEVFSEEENWFAAMEWADRKGADIISSSLGYTFNRYFPKQMDGKSTYISRMAEVAARKGMLVVNAAGNDGDNAWEVIGAPADADSVLTIGGIDSETGIHIGFSSFGPTYDGRLKPNVSAFADVYTTDKQGRMKKEYGTSFATPLVTGFAACVMQMHPDWNNMKVFREIEKSGHLYPYYDYAHGYGVPQASFILEGAKKTRPTFTVKREYSFLTVMPVAEEQNRRIAQEKSTNRETIRIILPNSNKTVIINNDSINVVYQGRNESFIRIPDQQSYTLDDKYLYYHFADKITGTIRYYAVVDLGEAKRYSIDLDTMKDSEVLRIHYRGYTYSYLK